ncbi:polysulfide reductase [Ktedonobacteria bacterium brp13]|nr:polysulfide reductase [Ktedonobacteria bacterium brp13]
MENIRVPLSIEAVQQRATSLLTKLGSDAALERLAVLTTGYTPDPEREAEEPTYYDYPSLKVPVWHTEIIWYFFFGGLAAGSYLIASLALLFGSKEDRTIVRAGYYLALLALLPCPPLLIADLGRPERFLHMLRVFKVRSPMSMGTWSVMGFSLFSGLAVVIQAARDGLLGKWWGARLLANLPQKLFAVPGAFFAAFLGSYTGVLLAATSVPLWSRGKMLGAVFISSAFSTSSALISIVLRTFGVPARTLHKLEKLEWTAMLLETVGLLAFLRHANRTARPLVGTGPNEHGHTFWRFMFGGGLLLPWLLQTLSLLGGKGKHAGHANKKASKVGILIPLMALIGGYFLRRTIVEAGRSSSEDAHISLWNARH